MPSQEDCIQKDPSKYPNEMAWSHRFQYLPFDVKFDKRGEGGFSVSTHFLKIGCHWLNSNG